ncbi:MAG TPA: hypothetical protein VF043_16555 [Ktedonobacteraceae bacterium]
MGPHNIRTHLPRRFALLSLMTFNALAMCSLFISGARSASAAPARFVLAGPGLVASPMNLTTCRQCMVTLSNRNSHESQTWSASSSGISGVTINPAGGMLQPKGQVSVTITMPSTIPCPANDTITFTGPLNAVNVSWSCMATPTPTPPPVTPAPTPPTTPTPSPTPSASPTPSDSSLTPTTTSVPGGGGQHTNGNPPGSSSSQGTSVPSILLSVAALLLALLAFTLYLISPAKASRRTRLLSLIVPVSFLRRLDQHPW